MSEGEGEIELRRIRLRKMREMLQKRPEGQKVERETSAIERLKRHLVERGEEVLNAAAELNERLVESVSEEVLRAIEEGRLRSPISGGELLRLFRRLGINVKLDTRVRIKKGGESRELKDALGESWKRDV